MVERWLAADVGGMRSPWRRSLWLANLFGEQALFLLRRGVTGAKRHEAAAAET